MVGDVNQRLDPDVSPADSVIDAESLAGMRQLSTIDVRSPAEFRRGHIPGATNIPLLDDTERAEVGTIYKHRGLQSAVDRGQELVGAKTDLLVDRVRELVTQPDLVVHCWRGGLRSQGFAGLLRQHGFQPRLLRGGYKAFRQAAHRGFAQQRRVIILGGHSGTGKTRLLAALRAAGHQVIDLEQLAHHRGSVFGGIRQPPQPTVEQFENELFLQWRDLDTDRPVWIEGESQRIGNVFIPPPVWEQMSAAPAIFVEVERRQRIQFLVQEYGDLPVDQLALALDRIKKRLGGERHRMAIDALQRNDVHTFAEIALRYYDKAYSNSLLKRPRDTLVQVPLASPGHADVVETLCRLADEFLTRIPSTH